MLNRWSALAALLGMLVGYAAANRPVAAQSGGFLVSSGERVTFINDDGRIMGGCVVATTSANYIGCTREGARDSEVAEWWRLDRITVVQRAARR